MRGEVLTDDWATSSFGYGSAMQENLAGIEDYTRVGCIIQPEHGKIWRIMSAREWDSIR